MELIVKKDMKIASGRFPLLSGSKMDERSRQADEHFEIQPRSNPVKTIDYVAEARSRSVLDQHYPNHYQANQHPQGPPEIYSKDIGLQKYVKDTLKDSRRVVRPF